MGSLFPPFFPFADDGGTENASDADGPGFTEVTGVTYDRLALGEPLTLGVRLRARRGAYELRYEIRDGIPTGEIEQVPLSEQWPSPSGSQRLEKGSGEDQELALVVDGPGAPGVYTVRVEVQPAEDDPTRLGSKAVNVAVVVDQPAVTDADVVSLNLSAADGSTIQTARQLIEEFAPILRLADGELYYPQSIEAALARARIRVDGTIADWEVGSARRLIHAITRVSAEVAFEVIVPPAASDVVYYASLHRSERGLAIGYWFFYAASNWRDFEPTGNSHPGDWEGLMILFDAPGDDRPPSGPTRVALAQHMPFSARFIQMLFDRVPQDDPDAAAELADRIVDLLAGGEVADWDTDTLQRIGNHLVLYVGLGSHVVYFDSQPRRYLCGAVDRPTGDGTAVVPPGAPASDLAANARETLTCTVVPLPSFSAITPDSPFTWLRFSGRWGESNDTADGALGNESGDDPVCALLAALSVGNDGPYGPGFGRVVFGTATSVGQRWLDPHAWADRMNRYPRESE